MLNRRQIMGTALAGGVALAWGARAASAQAPARAPARTASTPAQALALLQEGNRRFIADAPPAGPVSRERRLAVARGQAPFATLVSCSDSRVGPEQLFGRGLGELFIVRNAGNMVDTAALGSIEYSVGVLGVPLIVVLGHERCGAVAAAVEVMQKNTRFPGSIGRMVAPIIPAALEARGQPGDLLDRAIHQNVRRIVADLRGATEPILLDPQRTGQLWVVGAYYDLDEGRVDFFDLPPAAA